MKTLNYFRNSFKVLASLMIVLSINTALVANGSSNGREMAQMMNGWMNNGSYWAADDSAEAYSAVETNEVLKEWMNDGKFWMNEESATDSEAEVAHLLSAKLTDGSLWSVDENVDGKQVAKSENNTSDSTETTVASAEADKAVVAVIANLMEKGLYWSANDEQIDVRSDANQMVSTMLVKMNQTSSLWNGIDTEEGAAAVILAEN